MIELVSAHCKRDDVEIEVKNVGKKAFGLVKRETPEMKCLLEIYL